MSAVRRLLFTTSSSEVLGVGLYCTFCTAFIALDTAMPRLWLVVVSWFAATVIGWLHLRRRSTRARRSAAGLCVECGYDLTGNVSGVCPECGDGKGTTRWSSSA